MEKFLWILTILGSILGGLGVLGSQTPDSYVAQAALAARAVGFAVVPYCLARAVSEIKKLKLPK